MAVCKSSLNMNDFRDFSNMIASEATRSKNAGGFNAPGGMIGGYALNSPGLRSKPKFAKDGQFIDMTSTPYASVKIRQESSRFYWVSDIAQESALQYMMFADKLYDSESFRNQVQNIQHEYMAKGSSLKISQDLLQALMRMREQFNFYARQETHRHANVVYYDPTDMPLDDKFYASGNIYNLLGLAVEKLINLNGGVLRNTSGKYIVIVPMDIHNLLRSSLATQFGTLAQDFSNKGFNPSSGPLFSKESTANGNVIFDGRFYICSDTEYFTFESGTASSLKDLTISEDVKDFENILTLKNPYQKIKIKSAATAAFTIKKNAIIMVDGVNFLVRKDRPEGDTLTASDTSDVQCAFIVQEDASATANEVEISVSPNLYNNENIDLSKLVVGTKVHVIPNSRRILVVPDDGVIMSKCIAASVGVEQNAYVLYDQYDTYAGEGLNGRAQASMAVIYRSVQDEKTFDYNMAVGFRSYFTVFQYQNLCAQIPVPTTPAKLNVRLPFLNVKAVI